MANEPDPTGGTNEDLSSTSTTWSDIVGVPDFLKGISEEAKEFLKDPRGWIAGLIVGAILNVFGFISLKIEQFWRLLTGVLEDGGGSVYDSFASVGGSILGVVSGVESILSDLAATSPFGMLVALAIWMGIAFASIYVAIQLWNGLKKAIPWVIPWL